MAKAFNKNILPDTVRYPPGPTLVKVSVTNEHQNTFLFNGVAVLLKILQKYMPAAGCRPASRK